MKENILVIEDIKEMSQLVQLYLNAAGFTVVCKETAEEALELIGSPWLPELILLDLNLPGMSGYEFLKVLKKGDSLTNKNIPVIIVSARDSDEDIIQGLDIGACEFIVKPFSPKVLVARVEATLRERKRLPSAASENRIDFGPYTLLLESCRLKRGKDWLPLSAKEYEVLAYLAEHPNQNLSPERIYKDVWKNQYGDVSAVAVYIQRLRKKIEANTAEPQYIKTIFGMGYRFEVKGSIKG